MRIISGTYRSRLIDYPKSKNVRPSKDRVREAIFSILRHKIVNSGVLDLFAGSGAYGLESLSNGAKYVYFNDNFKLSYECIIHNINLLKPSNLSYFLLNLDYKDALDYFYKNNIKFDVVFLDPPYKLDAYQYCLDFLFDNDLINEGAFIIIECDSSLKFSIKNEKFLMKQYKYKDTIVYVVKEKQL